MHNINWGPITIAFLALLVFASAPRNLAVAHEGHQMECKKTSMQAVKADIQAMNDGEAKNNSHEGDEDGRGDDGQERHECV